MKGSHVRINASPLAAAVVLFSLGLAGCSVAPEPVAEPDAAATPAAPTEGDNDAHLCGVASAGDIAAIYGVEVGEGERVTYIHQEESGFQVVAPQCRWGADGIIEIELVYIQGTSFESRALECTEPSGLRGRVAEVEGLGERAWWTFGTGIETRGILNVCTADAMIISQVIAPTGESADLQAQATQLAQRVLALL